MRREFLEKLKIEKPNIEQIMAEYGKSITRLKADQKKADSKIKELEDVILKKDAEIADRDQKIETMINDDLKALQSKIDVIFNEEQKQKVSVLIV